MNHILLFSLISDFLFLTILKDKVVLASVQKDNFRQHSENFFSYLREILKKTNLNLSDFQKIYFTSGPGSHTGLRISLSFVLTLEVLNPLVKIYQLNSLFFQTGGDNSISLISIDLNKTKYHCAIYQNSEYLMKPKIIQKGELEEIKKNFAHLSTHIYLDFQRTNFLEHFQRLLSKFQPFESKEVMKMF